MDHCFLLRKEIDLEFLYRLTNLVLTLLVSKIVGKLFSPT